MKFFLQFLVLVLTALSLACGKGGEGGTTAEKTTEPTENETPQEEEEVVVQKAFNGAVRDIQIQSDGKILVGGDFTTHDDVPGINRLIRLNSDGSADSDFIQSMGTGFNGSVKAIHIQSDGKIIIGGDFTDYSGNTVGNIVRLNSDGTIDSTFQTNAGAGFDSVVNKISQRSNNDIVIVGDFSTYAGSAAVRFARLDDQGVLQ